MAHWRHSERLERISAFGRIAEIQTATLRAKLCADAPMPVRQFPRAQASLGFVQPSLKLTRRLSPPVTVEREKPSASR
jgi:hypothetical protein